MPCKVSTYRLANWGNLLLALLLLVSCCIKAQFYSSPQIRIDPQKNLFLPDTLNSFLVKNETLFIYPFHLNHSECSIGNKILRGTAYLIGFNISMGGYLLVAPENISKWNVKEKLQIPHIAQQYRDSYTKPPVIDHDMFIINYLGHPYQGGLYYNFMRSQGATTWQSSLFCVANSLLWEYGWEAGMEQPSIQDLISTPLAGILVGELSHVATLKMSRNGYRWYEAVLVTLINPTFAINQGFKFRKLSKPK